jgi:hypothetical protein
MTAYDDLSRATWWKSSRSNGSGGNNCVEVGFAGTAVGVRDSKDRGGPALAFAADQWRTFVTTVKTGALDLLA